MHTIKGHQEMMQVWRAQARNNPWLTLSFTAIVLIIAVLTLVSIYQGLQLDSFYYALAGGMSGFIATATGALLIYFTQTTSVRTQDSLLGFAAGMMLAASAFSLILPGIEAAQEILDQPFF